MPNPIKYNTSTESNALKSGNFWIGTGDVSKGPTYQSGFFNGYEAPAGGYVFYKNKTGDKTAVNTDLIFGLDPGNHVSYNSIDSSDTTRNVAPVNSDADGDMNNGITYSSSNGGTFVFDGVDDRIDVYTSPFYPGSWSSADVTCCMFINPSNSKNGNIATIENSWEVRCDPGGQVYFASNPWAWKGYASATPNTWQMITFVHDWSGTQKGQIWINETKGYEATINGALSSGSGYNSMRIMARHCCGGEYKPGSIGPVLIYDKALSSSEISQNFNAFRHRYGI